jgi:DnaK suppressor protein
MASESGREGTERQQVLRDLLTDLQSKETERIRALREDRSGDFSDDPGDTLDDARADEDLELHSALIDRAENRLTLIHEALERLDDGTYGICKKCKGEIEIERLKAMPFAELCGKCAGIESDDRAPGEESEELEHRWQPPEGIEDRLEGKEPLEEPDVTASDLAGENSVAAEIAEPRRRSVRKAAPQKRPAPKKSGTIKKKAAPTRSAAIKKKPAPSKKVVARKKVALKKKISGKKNVAPRRPAAARKKITPKKSAAKRKR